MDPDRTLRYQTGPTRPPVSEECRDTNGMCVYCNVCTVHACSTCTQYMHTVQRILVNPPQFVLKNIGGLMSLADYPNQFAVFCHNSCTKLMANKRVWWIKRWWINENSLYIHTAHVHSTCTQYMHTVHAYGGAYVL